MNYKPLLVILIFGLFYTNAQQKSEISFKEVKHKYGCRNCYGSLVVKKGSFSDTIYGGQWGNTVNYKLVKIDKKEVNIRLSKVYRNNTYTVDYGTLSAKERMKLISNDTFDIHDKLDGNELLIFIDDIKITGSHEYVVKKMLDTKNITNSSFFLYHAVLDNLAIDPQYENILNYSYLKGIDQLIQIAKRDDFILNTRFTKYLLSLSSSKLSIIP